MNNIKTIFKKEWDRVIHDRRLVFTAIILPGLLIFLIYTFMGTAIQNMTTGNDMYVAVVNPVSEFRDIYKNAENANNFLTEEIDTSEIDAYKTKIDEGEWEVLLIFDEEFSDYDYTGDKPGVSIYYNPNENLSSTAGKDMLAYLKAYQEMKISEYYSDINYFNLQAATTPVDENKIAGTLMSTLLPMLVVMFLFSGAMSIGPESIAGEKERNTIATLLITPAKRSEIALGKILSLSVLSLLSAVSSFLGIILSLPKLMQMDNSISMDIYGFGDYALLLVLLFSTVFVIVGIISCLSAYAKNLKEAGTLIMPFYIITILVAVTSMFSDGVNENLLMYVFPIYNTVQSMVAILTFEPQAWVYVSVSVAANLVYLALFIYVLNRMFNSEKIMFTK